MRRVGSCRRVYVMHTKVAAAAAFTVTALWSAAAWAHTSNGAGAPLTPLTGSSAPGLGSSHAAWIMAAVAAAAILFTAARGRRALGTALVALTLWIGFQAAAHSVHHLGQASDEARCAVASVTAQTSAIPTEAQASAAILLTQAAIARDFDAAAHRGALPATHEGRAPPRLAL